MWQMPARCNMASLMPGRIVEIVGAGVGVGVGVMAVGLTGCGVGTAVSSLMCSVVSVVCVFICGVVVFSRRGIEPPTLNWVMA